ncbi:hypothetical protein Tco_1278122 [Tanacetum coccineum]
MGDENPICTLGDYSKPSHEGYRNTIELPVGNNVAPLRSDTIRLVQNECSFHGLRSPHVTQYCMEDPEQAFVEYASSRTDETGGEITNKVDTVLKAITDQIAGTLPNDTVKIPKLGTHPVLSARSYPTKDPQCLTHIHSSINTITIYLKHPEEPQDNEPDVGQEEKVNLGNINSNPHPQPDPLASIATEQVRKLNSMLESLRLVPQSSNTKFICIKEDDGEVMFIEMMMNLKMRVPMKVKGQQQKDRR